MLDCISVDWLQLFGHVQRFTPLRNYEFKLEPYSTRQFKKLYSVYDAIGELYCTIQLEPFSSVIDMQACIIKLANRQLYKPNFLMSFENFYNAIGFRFKSISRIDIALDFQCFKFGLTPENFIRKFLDNVYLKNGRADYQLHGEQKDNHEFSYLRFGSNSSDVAVYLYNKSKEMQDVKMKNYIAMRWQAAGYDINMPVWRLEVSLKSSQIKVLNREDGELFDIDFDFIKSENRLHQLYKLLINKYFQFKHNDGTKNKSRMKTVELLRDHKTTWELYNYVANTDTTKADKIQIKKLHHIMEDFYGLPEEVYNAAQLVKQYYVQDKNLETFYNQKVAFSDPPRRK